MSELEAAELKQLKEDVLHLKAELFTLQKNQSSRRGPEGPAGKSGPSGRDGRDGRDAVVKIVQSDSKIKVLNNDAVVGEIVAVPGPEGKSIVGPSGKDSTVPGPRGESGLSPSVKEISAEVVKELGKIISKA